MRDWQTEAEELLKKFKEMPWKAYDEVISFLLDWQSENTDLGIIDCDMVDDCVTYRLEKSGYQGVIYLLHGISERMNESYFVFDGYGNLQNIENRDIECWLEDISNDYL